MKAAGLLTGPASALPIPVQHRLTQASRAFGGKNGTHVAMRCNLQVQWHLISGTVH